MIVTKNEVVVAKILSEGCTRREDLDDEFSIFFSIEYRGDLWSFQIPQPLENGGYTLNHLKAIDMTLERLGLDLLPLDQNLII